MHINTGISSTAGPVTSDPFITAVSEELLTAGYGPDVAEWLFRGLPETTAESELAAAMEAGISPAMRAATRPRLTLAASNAAPEACARPRAELEAVPEPEPELELEAGAW
jgi:hypothetical protein